MNMSRPPLILSLSALSLLVAACGCGGPSFTENRYQDLVSSNDVKDMEHVASILGPGETVANEYTAEQVALHELPDDTTFQRWQHPDDPTTYSYIGFSNGQAIHFTTFHTQ